MALFGSSRCDPRRCGGVVSRAAFLGKAKLYGALGLAAGLYAVHATDGTVLAPVTAWLEELAAVGAAGATRQTTGQGTGRATGRAASSSPPAAPGTPAAAAALLDNRRLDLAGRAAADLRAGIVDARLVALLGRLLADYRLSVGVFKTGHRKYVKGTRHVSQHYGGHACDIGAVNGHPVTAGSRDARRLVATLAELDAGLRPSEVGSPFGQFAPLRGFFTDDDHRGHIHIGVAR